MAMNRALKTLICLDVIVFVLSVLPAPAGGHQEQLWRSSLIAQGWYPWYEIKADPENPQNLIVCGTKWSAARDGPFGFVYSSSDEGVTWRVALEDKHSSWVTEQSCSFGPGHRAYFISEASRVIDGQLHHSLGTTRLYVSTDAGQHWQNTIETGWADWSTSAVSRSGTLLTFFNAITNDPSRQSGGTIGLLLFPSNGKEVAGPLFDSRMQLVGYQGVYPQDAVALGSGAVVALYYGTKRSADGLDVDLGIVRALSGQQTPLESSTLARTILQRDCLTFDRAALAYQPNSNRLFLVYVEGCTDARLLLTWSNDGGRSWSNAVQVADVRQPTRRMSNLSLTTDAHGRLWLLWEEKARSGRWFLSYIRNRQLTEPATELSAGSKALEITNDSLWTSIGPPVERGLAPDAAIDLNVRTEFNTVWRCNGLSSAGNNVIALWSSGTDKGMGLNSAVATEASSWNTAGGPAINRITQVDMTRQAVVLYGGTQEFNRATGVLNVCLEIGNRGSVPIRTPIELVAEQFKSSLGSISVLNSTNNLKKVGAAWDVTHSVTGAEIPPFANSNSFCLTFQITPPLIGPPRWEGDDLITLRLKVLASGAK